MIEAKGSLEGAICSKQTIEGNINKAIEYIDPVTQEKTIDATKETQVVVPDENYTGLSKVTINGYVPNVDKKTITKNGIYKATDDNLDGYNEVDVETSGVDINDYFVTTIDDTNGQSFFARAKFLKKNPKFIVTATNCNYMFEAYSGIMPSKNELNLNGVKTMKYGFSRCNANQIIDYDFSTLEDVEYLFQNMYQLNKISLIDFGSVKNIQGALNGVIYITDLEGFKDLGKAYDDKYTNYTYYRLNLSYSHNLTHESLMNVINNLYDIKTKGCKTQELVLGSDNIAKLTSEEIAVATEKGWTVS